MSQPIIEVRGLSKRYHLGAIGATSLREETSRLWDRLRGIPHPDPQEFWALRDVSFDVQPGEVVGVIGRNGAGKSTLLKILSRITEPTNGTAKLRGRVASLLEVGTGFHPDLSGRENIYLNGAILGMSRIEIRRKFDEIVAFAEVERFLDTPVKRYSSGMYVRLAFAVAAHLEPEILIVDEVLAVGDAQFQKKCLGKIKAIAAGDGRTVLFVSHNMPAVLRLTSRCILLSAGRVAFNGPSALAIENYETAGAGSGHTIYDVADAPRAYQGTGEVRFTQLSFPRPSAIFAADEDVRFVARIVGVTAVERVRFSLTVFAADGLPVGSCFSVEREGIAPGQIREKEIVLPHPMLAPGNYYLGVAVGKGNHRTGHVDYDVVLETLHFQVSPTIGDAGTLAQWPKNWGSIVLPELLVQEPLPCSPVS